MKKPVKEKSIRSKASESVKQDKKEFKIEIVKVGKLEDKTAGGPCVLPGCECSCDCISCECACVEPG